MSKAQGKFDLISQFITPLTLFYLSVILKRPSWRILV